MENEFTILAVLLGGVMIIITGIAIKLSNNNKYTPHPIPKSNRKPRSSSTSSIPSTSYSSSSYSDSSSSYSDFSGGGGCD